MKKFLRSILVCCMAIAAILLSAETASAFTVTVRNADNAGVVLRSSPNEKSKWTGPNAPHFFTGEVLDAVGTIGNYYQVVYGNEYYFIPMKYATAKKNVDIPTEIEIKNADNAGVVLRTLPDEKSKLTGPRAPHFFTGDRLKCVGVEGQYYEVEYHEVFYYIPKKYADPIYG